MSLTGLLCALALCAQVPQDPVTVAARLTDSQVEVGNTTSLLITVTTEGVAPDRIVMPTLPSELDVVGTSDYTHTQLRLRGQRTRLTRRDVAIVPRAPGVYRIPPISVEVRGATYTTAPLNLVVTGRALTPGSLASRASRLEVVLQPDTVYVGEQVLFEAEATFSEEARMRQSRPPVFEPPAPTGFWIQDLPDPVSVTLRVSEGRSIEIQTFRRAYFPLRPGEYRLPPARIHYEVRRGFLYAPESRELVSDSALLVVLDVPAEGRPASYNGAVGQLEMRTSIEPQRLRVGEPAVITVELEGTGNVKSLPPPQLPELERAEVFAPTQETAVEFDGNRVGGLKRFRWMIVPEQAGELVIPPIEYGVFDPELRTWVVLSSDTLRVEAAPVVAGAPVESGVRGLRQEMGDQPLGWVRSPAFAAAQAVPLLLLLGMVGVRRRRSRPPTGRERARVVRRRLRSLGPDADAALIERTLRGGVLHVLDVADGDPVERLRNLGHGPPADRLAELLTELRRARYEPGATFDGPAILARADTLIRDIAPRRTGWRAWGSEGQGGTRTALLLLPALLAPALLLAPRAGDAQHAAFGRALELFEKGQPAAAANEFHAYATSREHDVNAWYNAGVAAYHADDHGRAVWSWLRALRLDPRDDDVWHNLRIAEAESVARRVAPPDRLSHHERALTAAVAWWLMLLGIGVAVLTSRRRPLWLVLPAAAVLAGVSVAAMLIGSRPTIVVPMGDGATLYAAPTIREETVSVLPPGAYALLLERRGDWLLLRSETGSDAWAERAAVASAP